MQAAHRGALQLRADGMRRVLAMPKCRVVAQTAGGVPLLEVKVTLAAAQASWPHS
jgi:hypothetical protein